MIRALMNIAAMGFVCALFGCEFERHSVKTAESAAHSSCVSCHQGDRSFVGYDQDNLAELIKAIRDFRLQHPPLALSDSSDTAIEALARELISE